MTGRPLSNVELRDTLATLLPTNMCVNEPSFTSGVFTRTWRWTTNSGCWRLTHTFPPPIFGRNRLAFTEEHSTSGPLAVVPATPAGLDAIIAIMREAHATLDTTTEEPAP